MDDSNIVTFRQPEILEREEENTPITINKETSVHERLINRIDMLSGEIRKDMGTIKQNVQDHFHHFHHEINLVRRKMNEIENQNQNRN